jgi:hypothetical protein
MFRACNNCCFKILARVRLTSSLKDATSAASALSSTASSLPSYHHVKIGMSETEGRLIGVIGDIHGCYDEMVSLLDKLQIYSKERGKEIMIFFVGDLVGKGPPS